MSKHWLIRVLLVPAACAALAGSVVAQKQQDVTGAVEAARADLRADKLEIVNRAMNLNAAEGAKFWPIYREYENEVANLNDQRLELLKEYGEKLNNMTDKDAKRLSEKFFDLENQRTDLRRDYFDRFKKATSAVTAAKFFQVEHRLDVLTDLKIASAVPGLYERGETATSTK
jgi:hypothetical protein